jgi:pimeloyl-ACP methyl ester carboxylesterase
VNGRFQHDGFELAFMDEGEGEPVLLIHGFASSAKVNWISTGWTNFLQDSGFRAIAFDNRGHGQTSKSYREEDYAPGMMASDAAALLHHLGISRAHVMGYSMGARISAFLALNSPELVQSVIFGGLGDGMFNGVGDWDPIAAALLSDAPEKITDPRGAAFRKFADQTHSDRRALAACIARSRELITPEQLASILTPALVAVGTGDDIGGSARGLASVMNNAQAFAIEGRDHMLAVGDRSFKKAALDFLRRHPI